MKTIVRQPGGKSRGVMMSCSWLRGRSNDSVSRGLQGQPSRSRSSLKDEYIMHKMSAAVDIMSQVQIVAARSTHNETFERTI